jgi:hypothetical protein
MRRLTGSSRNPKGTTMSPERSHLPVKRRGVCMSQCRTRSKMALISESVIAEIEIPAERPGRARVKRIINAKERKGGNRASVVDKRVVSWR